MLGRVRVAGHSMEPALYHGDHLLIARIPPRVGSVVIARDPREDRLVVKRVAAMSGDDLILESDNPGHEMLVMDRRAVIGRAILRYRPLNRSWAIRRNELHADLPPGATARASRSASSVLRRAAPTEPRGLP
ncbi:MAG: S24/S26 family peptidase [Chloroflexi bacterium]|nr:S24/S26 family peptidase [Chloroflexota bacterium]